MTSLRLSRHQDTSEFWQRIYLDVKMLGVKCLDRLIANGGQQLRWRGWFGGGGWRHSMAEAARDEVDRLVAAWRRERPDLDVQPLEVLSRVTRLARHLDRARRTAFAEHGLEPWEFDVLSALRRAGAPYQLSPGQLLTQTLVTSGTMTNRIDRLAAG